MSKSVLLTTLCWSTLSPLLFSPSCAVWQSGCSESGVRWLKKADNSVDVQDVIDVTENLASFTSNVSSINEQPKMRVSKDSTECYSCRKESTALKYRQVPHQAKDIRTAR